MDRKARKILLDTFWSSAGWKSGVQFSGEAFEYAKSQGVMFDPLTISHDDAVRQLVELHRTIPRRRVARAFLHSLSTRKVYLRSALSSWVLTQHLAAHAFESNVGRPGNGPGLPQAMYGDCYVCDRCRVASRQAYNGEDLNVLQFERVKWGGIRLNMLLYCLLDLQFLPEEEPEVTAEDIGLLQAILDTIASSSPEDTPRKLEKRLNGVFPSSKQERDVLLEILAYAGILVPAPEPRKGGGNSDFFAVINWRGIDGYSEQAVQELFAD
ncbi:hypothetical protein [Paenibacillus sp. y28]|uniref:hypothetical protein n=1 Tax=Paenibacillus sp. y28 TaxID=3129110 RepID=UPI0030176970